jgi:hypothetical protein
MALFKNLDTQAGKPKSLRLGQIAGVTATGTMSGYVDGASLTISAPPGGGVQAVGTIQVTGGAITGVVLSNPGAGYTSAPTVTAPAGTGATLTPNMKFNRAGISDNADIVFVSNEESLLSANRLKGIKTAGWYKITEKMTNEGTLRYSTENLVSMSALSTLNATSGDNTDDLVAGDVEISITTQPAAASVTAPAATTFTVVASGATTYQWQLQTSGVGAYANISNGGVYTTATTATLNISNSTGLNGNRYRCVVGNGGTAGVKTNGARLTVA